MHGNVHKISLPTTLHLRSLIKYSSPNAPNKTGQRKRAMEDVRHAAKIVTNNST